MRWFLEGSSMCKNLGWGDGAGPVVGRAEGRRTEKERQQERARSVTAALSS